MVMSSLKLCMRWYTRVNCCVLYSLQSTQFACVILLTENLNVNDVDALYMYIHN